MGVTQNLIQFNIRLQAQSDDPIWLWFCGYLMSSIYLQDNTNMRLGQAIMNGLNQDYYTRITGTQFDIREVTNPNDPRLDRFAEQIFNIYSETM